MIISAYGHGVGAAGFDKILRRPRRLFWGHGFAVGITVLVCMLPSMCASAQDAAASETAAGTAIRRIVEGNYTSAAQNLRRAMEVTPDDALLNIAAGAVSVCTND